MLPQVLAALATASCAVLVAAPGAGKTTRVPLALLDAPWRGDGRILVLEPRRLAARAAAQQMARLLGEEVGATVGYRVRLEHRVSARTRVEVVTEGILTRMVQDDPALEGVAALCFDEFHERNLPSDLGLALALESRAVLRPDLRLLVMSATLEAAPVARLLAGITDTAGSARSTDSTGAESTGAETGADSTGADSAAPVIVSAGREFPVRTEWRALRDGAPPAAGIASAIRHALAAHEGDVLVFLPGIADLHRVRTTLEGEALPDAAQVVLLHGSLTLDEQDHVLRPRDTRRRVILSTAIAESSVTLAGVRIVIDAGRARVPRYDPRSGMTRLTTVRVSQASADQRRGRAGRTAPGLCIRLWDEGTHAALPARAIPEILNTDLTPLALELACAGIHDPLALRWLDAPPAGALAKGRALLADLGALDAAGRVTPHGRAMAALGIPPRLAHLVLVGAARGAADLACDLAALLAERDVLRREAAEFDVDLTTRLDAVRGRGVGGGAGGARGGGARGVDGNAVDAARLARVRQESRALRAALPASTPTDTTADDALTSIGALVALAYPDRLAQRRPGEAPRYRLRNGRGARLATPQSLGNAPFLAVADVDGDPTESRIWLAAPLTEAELRAAAGAALVTERDVAWDDTSNAVRAVETERVGALILRERPLRDANAEEIADALLGALVARALDTLPWRAGDRALRARMAFAHHVAPNDFPDVADAALVANAESWLRPSLSGLRRLSDVAQISLEDALLTMLPWQARARLDSVAPTHLEVPSGSRIAIDYAEPAQPVLAVKLQEVFGLTETPRIAEGRVPLTLHLLSPAGRPVQVTRDLASFWRSGYFDVRRDLKGRYPRHPWPDDPLSASPTRRVKPRGT